MKGVAVIAACVALACTKPNPRSCADGSCTDPAFPFCDVEGTLGGAINECIAVTCDPGQFEACRDDLAVTCNGTGNNFGLVECPLGCDSSVGCRDCLTDTDCANPAPICENGARCRACALDDECPSRVCDLGSCVPESMVIYAAPSGANDGSCSLTAPCSLPHAVVVAAGSVPSPIVRALPGIYTSLLVNTATQAPIVIVGAEAALTGITALEVTAGANVTARGFTYTGQDFGVSCGESSMPKSTLNIIDGTLSPGSGTGTLITIKNCGLRLDATELRADTNSNLAIGVGTDSAVTADRIHISGAQPVVGLIGTRAGILITNSVLEDVAFQFSTVDTGPPGSSASIGFSTLVLTSQGGVIDCDPNSGSANRVVRFENNILFASGTQTTSIIQGNDCRFTNNIIFPEQSPPANNIVADPLLVDVAAKDFHLMPSSPALGAADPTLFVFSDHDFDGTSRPQGSAPDIGAFEQ